MKKSVAGLILAALTAANAAVWAATSQAPADAVKPQVTALLCKGCLACQQTGNCVIKDDANAITDKMLEADVVAWATPIYYYEMSGQMKTMIDRAKLNP